METKELHKIARKHFETTEDKSVLITSDGNCYKPSVEHLAREHARDAGLKVYIVQRDELKAKEETKKKEASNKGASTSSSSKSQKKSS